MTSEEVRSEPLRFEMKLQEDVGAELEEFLLIARLGLVDEANAMLKEVLFDHLWHFPVVAEVGLFLTQQQDGPSLQLLLTELETRHLLFDPEDSKFITALQSAFQPQVIRKYEPDLENASLQEIQIRQLTMMRNAKHRPITNIPRLYYTAKKTIYGLIARDLSWEATTIFTLMCSNFQACQWRVGLQHTKDLQAMYDAIMQNIDSVPLVWKSAQEARIENSLSKLLCCFTAKIALLKVINDLDNTAAAVKQYLENKHCWTHLQADAARALNIAFQLFGRCNPQGLHAIYLRTERSRVPHGARPWFQPHYQWLTDKQDWSPNPTVLAIDTEPAYQVSYVLTLEPNLALPLELREFIQLEIGDLRKRLEFMVKLEQSGILTLDHAEQWTNLLLQLWASRLTPILRKNYALTYQVSAALLRAYLETKTMKYLTRTLLDWNSKDYETFDSYVDTFAAPTGTQNAQLYHDHATSSTDGKQHLEATREMVGRPGMVRWDEETGKSYHRDPSGSVEAVPDDALASISRTSLSDGLAAYRSDHRQPGYDESQQPQNQNLNLVTPHRGSIDTSTILPLVSKDQIAPTGSLSEPQTPTHTQATSALDVPSATLPQRIVFSEDMNPVRIGRHRTGSQTSAQVLLEQAKEDDIVVIEGKYYLKISETQVRHVSPEEAAKIRDRIPRTPLTTLPSNTNVQGQVSATRRHANSIARPEESAAYRGSSSTSNNESRHSTRLVSNSVSARPVAGTGRTLSTTDYTYSPAPLNAYGQESLSSRASLRTAQRPVINDIGQGPSRALRPPLVAKQSHGPRLGFTDKHSSSFTSNTNDMRFLEDDEPAVIEFNTITGKLQDFVLLSMDDFEGRARFLKKYPELLRSNLADLYLEAEYQMREEDYELAKQCICSMAIIRLCDNLRNAIDHIEARVLAMDDEKTTRSKQYNEMFAAIEEKVRHNAKAQKRASVPRGRISEDPSNRREPFGLRRPTEPITETGDYTASPGTTSFVKSLSDLSLDPKTGGPRKVSADDLLEHISEFARDHQENDTIAKLEPEDFGDIASRSLSSKYRVPSQGATFFVPGRVFSMLYHENVGQPHKAKQPRLPTDELSEPDDGYVKGSLAKDTVIGRYGQPIYSHIRRMVVIRSRKAYCWVISIGTYGGKGLKKRGLNQDQIDSHAIVYNAEMGPEWLRDEPTSVKRAIGVKMADDQELSTSSRLYFGRPFTVEYNTRVMNVGMVIKEHLPVLMSEAANELLGTSSK